MIMEHFQGETKAVDEFFADKGLIIEKLPMSHIPSFSNKEIESNKMKCNLCNSKNYKKRKGTVG